LLLNSPEKENSNRSGRNFLITLSRHARFFLNQSKQKEKNPQRQGLTAKKGSLKIARENNNLRRAIKLETQKQFERI
jgi:phosphoglycerol transferase MdoB-like AlkP superfamily enzyme